MKKIVLLFLSLLLLAPIELGARDSKFTRKGTGPMYWIAYEYCYDHNVPMMEQRWRANIDWMARKLKDYGYDMISTDGWIEAAQSINSNGFITKYDSAWEHDFVWWNKYIFDKGMKAGVYYNPLWMTRTAYSENCPVLGSDKKTQDIAGDKPFNGELHWVDVDKDGAEAWVKGYVRYFINLGFSFLRIDFLENYERQYGTQRYAKALRWIMEEAGDDIFLSLVMPNCYEHAATELLYGDMIRIDDDCFEGDWNFVCARRRGEVKNHWPVYPSVFDGMIGFSDIIQKGKMIADGDFMRLNRLANTAERRFLFSIMVMGGSALAIADQFDTVTDDAMEIYRNSELIELNKQGFVAKPLSRNIRDIKSSTWVGKLSDGSFVVALFNRENKTMEYGIRFDENLGIESGMARIRDLWEHSELGIMEGGFSRSLEPHSCVVIKVTPTPKNKSGFGCTRQR